MRTHLCAELDRSAVGQAVGLYGWVHRRRDHGGVIFLDLRDRSGRVQIVVDPENGDVFREAELLRNEYVLFIEGVVRLRPDGTTNPKMVTGEIEVVGTRLKVLNSSDPLPFQLEDEDVSEAVRLRYRYLDLRSDRMQSNLRLRHKAVSCLRRFLESRDFIDIETPMLTKSTPEGARDYLVPSRIYPDSFFALPQSPQLFKQLLMIGGFERYYQIARCFRDEDLRSDRQPEFTQLDMEISFTDEQEVIEISEHMIHGLFEEALEVVLPRPFPVISFSDAMSRFGTDRPDLRIPFELIEIADLMKEVEFKVFSEPAQKPGSRVVALRIPDGGALTRQQIDKYTDYVRQYGAAGLAYIKVNSVSSGRDGLQSPILKFLTDDVITLLIARTQAVDGDLIFFGADTASVVNDSLGALRVRLGHDLGWVSEEWCPLWIIDFPLFQWNQQTKAWDSVHHPFTSPRQSDIELLAEKPGAVIARAYDMVLNGTEIGGGSIRIHNADLQERVFETLGISKDESTNKFGFLLEALRYGTPPHGGIAFGLDRIVSMMAREMSIREVVAFPKTQKSACLMTGAPSVIESSQLDELSIIRRSISASVEHSN
ncbi:MAG: aspartate--tRNA ligase [Acidiferrobacteraceae bacterium]|nr:aspartate--tRNA ligase [Acidiferrobacteraceae bacterium]